MKFNLLRIGLIVGLSVAIFASNSGSCLLAAFVPDTPPPEEAIAGTADSNFEVGYDFVLSSMGPYTDPDYDALNPAVAYNSVNQQYLVVWSGSDDIVGEYEIWGQRVNAVTGAQIGADFKISVTGFLDDDDPNLDANDPDVVYNSATNEYLVVWSADHYINNEFEIFGRRIDASNGNLLSSQVRITVIGPTNNTAYDATDPAIAYNSVDNEYLVVFSANSDAPGLVVGEFEIWAKRLSSTAEWIGTEMRMSDMGGSGDANYDAYNPDVAYDRHNQQYFIVWYGDDPAGDLVDNEYEIWGQRVNHALGGVGDNDFRISYMYYDGYDAFDAYDPAIVYNPQQRQFLVVWEGDKWTNEYYAIHGQRFTGTAVPVGNSGFYISHSGVGPNNAFDAYNPAVTWDSANNEYFVVWQDDEMGALEFEIWGQRLDRSCNEMGNDTRLSDMGPEGNAAYIAQTPAVVYSDRDINQYLVVWSGDNSTDGEFEIWAQRYTGAVKVFLPMVMRD